MGIGEHPCVYVWLVSEFKETDETAWIQLVMLKSSNRMLLHLIPTVDNVPDIPNKANERFGYEKRRKM